MLYTLPTGALDALVQSAVGALTLPERYSLVSACSFLVCTYSLEQTVALTFAFSHHSSRTQRRMGRSQSRRRLLLEHTAGLSSTGSSLLWQGQLLVPRRRTWWSFCPHSAFAILPKHEYGCPKFCSPYVFCLNCGDHTHLALARVLSLKGWAGCQEPVCTSPERVRDPFFRPLFVLTHV
jgi:hypothetical protein